ncbi:MAG: ATP-binding protein [Gemmatimonadaceae bacterium]
MPSKTTIASDPGGVRLSWNDRQDGSPRTKRPTGPSSRALPRAEGSLSAASSPFVRATTVGGIVVALIGAAALTGWVTGSRTLSAGDPTFIPVAPNTALLFVLLGASVCTFAKPSRVTRLFARPAIALSFLVSGARLAEYVVGANLSVDQWLFAFPSESFGLAPVGKMAFFTAVTFFFSGLALFALTFEIRKRSVNDAVRAVALLVTLIGGIFSLGYLYDAPLLYGTSSIPMALPTAVAFVVLGLSMAVPAILADRVERRKAAAALRIAHDELEQRVAERTAELVSANQRLKHTVLKLEEQTTEAEDARQTAHTAKQRYRTLVDGLAIGVVLMTPEGIQMANPSAERILGLSFDQMRGLTSVDPTWRAVHEDGSPFPGETFPVNVSLTTGESQYQVVMGMHRPDGSVAWIEVNSDPLFRSGERTPYAAVASFADITARKVAEAELRKSEEQLQQSQKMEAIGQLAGGVAHDFNNMLAAIKVYAEMLLLDQGLGDNHRGDLNEIRKAADRAAALTRQLLAFSRKQVMQPKETDLNSVVSELEGMLQRLMIGDVELSTTLEPELGLVKVDPGQIEQVLMNLVVNARDAMPDGGRITVRTEKVVLDSAYCADQSSAKPGPHVLLAVSDTGHGMDSETQKRIFEPFFTTKERGRGTGLGLSTVYGIVKQSGGHLRVYSEVGHGTVFKIYFPRVDGVAAVLPAESGAITIHSRGSATILLVDDEEFVRRPVKKFLERTGYQVLEAASGTEALSVCAEHSDTIHLVITDMMMPGMNGRALMDRLAGTGHAAKVLFTSGYTGDEIIRGGLLHSDMAFIEKPFNLADLAEKVRGVLETSQAVGK